MDSTRYVFLYGTGTATTMTRRYGWAPKGERVVDATPRGHWKVTTFVAALRERPDRPMALDEPMMGEVFQANVEQVQIPELLLGDVVTLDNLVAHKVAGIREIHAAGAGLLYLPPYSPDLNLIEIGPTWNL